MALSETEICNLALSLSGNKRISALDEGTEESRVCSLLYGPIRDEVLAEPGVNWRCATARADCGSELDTDPEFGWEYQYQIPTNPPVLRVIAQVTDDQDQKAIPWLREGDRILTNEDSCYILYIRRLTDVTKFPPLLVEAIYTKLASKLAVRLSQDWVRARDLLLAYATDVLLRAKQANASESYVENESGSNDWSSAGR